MKKVLTVLVAISVVLLAGCIGNTDLEQDITVLKSQISLLESAKETQSGNLADLKEEFDELHEELHELHDELHGSEELIEKLQEENAALKSEVNDKIKNALNRENWASRKVRYNADWTSYEAEYCLGVMDDDWSTLQADDYSQGEGLLFIITIEEILWDTEILVKDSCGNYSTFLYSSSPFSLYSVPVGMFEVGKTYEVILYKETYFTVPQLGLLPLAEMGEWGAYPEDLSGIIVTEIS